MKRIYFIFINLFNLIKIKKMLRSSGNCLLKLRLNAFKNFNKFPIKNFYFQESGHGAGEVSKFSAQRNYFN